MLKSRIILITLVLALAATGVLAAGEEAPKGVVNINTADATQIALLPGIGQKTAERIIAWREEHGGFQKPTDLMQVKGVGDRTFERLSPYVVVEGKTTLTEAVPTPRKARAPKPSSKAQR